MAYADLGETRREYTERVARINASRPSRPLCYTHTYGCQQNENDTEYLNGMLLQMGFEFTDDRSRADLILLNTCAVREHAEQRVFGNIGALVGLKRDKPELIICICGCMAGQSHVCERIRESHRHVDLVFGTHALAHFPQNLYRVLTEHTRVFDVEPPEKPEIAEGLPICRASATKAWVSVMSGCNNFCSYCIVPYVRGRERSRSPQSVLDEVRGLVRDGYKDITLLGQNVNSYHKDVSDAFDFADLLAQIDRLDGDFTVKFMTSHPKDASDKLFETIARGRHLCRHLHLPFQSGSDAILAAMNRRYTRERYLRLIESARSKIPDLSVTADVIVGFPGETEQDFEQTLSLVEQVRFNGLFTFIFSPRRGTPAAKMPDQIPPQVKSERFRRLVDLQTEISTQIHTGYIGTTQPVLVEGAAEKGEGLFAGRTDNNTLVQFTPAGTVAAGDRVAVRIEKALNWAIFGKMEAKL